MVACGIGATLAEAAAPGAAGTIPITTSSPEAKKLYLEGREFADTLRATDARKLYEQAVAKDPAFARAYFDIAANAGTAKEFFDAVKGAREACRKK